MDYRMERDSMGEMEVPADRYWGAQTQRSYQNFQIGTEKMPEEIVRAFGILKKAAALANHRLGKLDDERLELISRACDEVVAGKLDGHFPLVVWQTGSGTQSNMNVNEVVANRGNELAGKKLLHPNDHVNMSQSSNDTFPTAMHIAAAVALEDKLLPAIDGLVETFRRLEGENGDVVKSGRTHLQDAVPITLAQEISGWRTSLEKDRAMVELALPGLRELALGGTAVGTGLNAPKGFDTAVAEAVSELTGKPLCHGPQQVPRPHQQGRAGVRPRGAQGPGGGSDENRQRRALAGLRPPVPWGDQIRRNEPALHHARQSPALHLVARRQVTMVAVYRWMANDVAVELAAPGQLRAERVHAGVHLRLPPVRAAAHRLHPLL